MGSISLKLKRHLKKANNRKLIDLSAYREVKEEFRSSSESINSMDDLLKQGYDPVHAAYVNTQNLMSAFAEHISVHPAMDSYYRAIERAQELYQPDGPPWSPLTRSFFTLWAFNDLTFGINKESIATILWALAPMLGINEGTRTIVKFFAESRMGVYEHGGLDGSLILLKELLTEKMVRAISPSGYVGQEGDLLYVRVLPNPVDPEEGYSVVMITPYRLLRQGKQDWQEFFQRNSISRNDPGFQKKYHKFMKHGPERFYWTEYVFESYVNISEKSDVIYLTGIPDLKDTKPHAKDSRYEELFGRGQLSL